MFSPNDCDKPQVTGPIPIAAFMRQVLTSPEGGYYTSKPETGDVFGKHGDFVTSPEISQVFGELIGIWTIAEWMSQGRKRSGVQLMEVGPGKGTLMDDLLRVSGCDDGFYHRLTNWSRHSGILRASLLASRQFTWWRRVILYDRCRRHFFVVKLPWKKQTLDTGALANTSTCPLSGWKISVFYHMVCVTVTLRH